MNQWNISNFLYTLFHTLFIGNPTTQWSRLLAWFVRITTISLLLRTYIAPWLLALTSNHIRIRSISLRSIKGLYFKKGRWICRAERIGYVFGKVDGRKRLTVRIDGLKIEMQKAEERVVGEDKNLKRARHRRNLTLADLNPSPLAGYLWGFVTKVALALEPWLRPLIRNTVVACLQVVIQWLPAVTQALSFELHSTVFSLAQIPGTQVVADEINLHAELKLVQMENWLEEREELGHKSVEVEDRKVPQPSASSWTFYGMAAWRKKMSDGLRRALDRAWGKMHGSATICFKLNDVAGATPKQGQLGHESSRTFLRLPGTVELNGKFKFFPQSSIIDSNSITLGLKVDEIAVGIDLLNDILRIVVPTQQETKHLAVPVTTVPVTSASPLSKPSGVASEIGIFQTVNPPAKRLRSSTIFSTSFLPSSPAVSLRSLEGRLLSPRASATPFLKAFSSSRGGTSIQPERKLKNRHYKTILSTIKDITVQVSSVSLSFSSSTSHTIYYKTVVRDVRLGFHPSDSSSDPLHAQWLGRIPKSQCFDPEAYGLQLRITTIVFERHKRGDIFPLITLGTLDFQAVAYQWPSPWLMPCIFLQGDPNAPFLATSLRIGGLDMTDRLEDLRDLLERRISKPKDTTAKQNLLAMLEELQFPRCSVQVHCGAICARMICENDVQQTSSTLEMRTDGFSFGVQARYDTAVASQAGSLGDARLLGAVSFNLEPVLCHVRSGWATVGFASDNDFLNDPPVLSIGAIEVGGDVRMQAEEEHGLHKVKKSSIFCDLHTVIDTISVELWHAASVSATVQLLAMLPASPSRLVEDEVPAGQLTLYPGFTASLTLERFIVVITAPDINPKEMDLSRGIGLRALVSLELCTSNSKSDSNAQSSKPAKSRRLLGLPKERLVDALAKGQSQPSGASAVARLSVSNLVVRSAVATQFESDDPFLAGRDDLTPTDEEFVRVKFVKVDASFPASEGEDTLQYTCQVIIDVPSIRANFQLGNVYCALLALQTIQNLAHVRASDRRERRDSESTSMQVSVECRLQMFNLLWALPNQTVVSLLEDACFTLLPQQPIQSQFKSLSFWVPPSTAVNKWENDWDQKWDELLSFHQWDVSSPVVEQSISITAKGDSLRLRIPHGFMLADLILDLTVVAKAAKHLVRIVKSGMFADIPAPEPEGPKLSPNMTFEVGSFCIEAIDDPFEARLGAIWRIGLEAVKQRLEREEAFIAKLAAINAAGDNSDASVVVEGNHDYRFTAKHTVPIDDARRRLDEVHFLDWKFRLQNLKTAWARQETTVLHRLYGPQLVSGKAPFAKSKIAADTVAPPLFRLFISSLNLSISLPTFPLDKMSDFLYEQGKGLPKDTGFSLLVPLHINFTLNSVRVTVRDFPIPLLHVQRDLDSQAPAWTFDSDVVIAEEMGSDLSSDWIECPVLSANQGIYGTRPLALHVPKTIMPVKSYACPVIDIATTCPTILSWGVSYNPAIQDIVRIIETLTPNPRDPSPPIGFWDKLRLIAHWETKFSFKGEVRCYLKGSRDPVQTTDSGTGFVLVWKGSPRWLIGCPNDQEELMQVISDVMLIAIPRFGEPASDGFLNLVHSSVNPYRKICAELHSGVRYGIGFVFERTCDTNCLKCSGNLFQRQCRMFNFIPHYRVRLETKSDRPGPQVDHDSYRAFRSDFIHFSFSLLASTKTRSGISNALHLTPKAFAHFWAWCSLFDSIPTLRIRMGTYFVPRTITPKFGRQIVTIKYRIVLTKLFVMHGYIDDSHETWADGITPWIGVKSIVDELRVDMHQRDQETQVRGIDPGTIKTAHHKPFYAAEVVLKGLDLRTVLAIFQESTKREVALMATSPSTGAYLKYDGLPTTHLTSQWYNSHDFVELDWTSSTQPSVHYLPLVTCPRFAYFKRNAAKVGNKQNKFGIENTHHCLLEQEPSAPKIQIGLAVDRIDELKYYQAEISPYGTSQPRQRMIALLQDYIKFLQESEAPVDQHPFKNYHMPSEVVLPEEWAEFDHTYQLHCPKLYLDKATRDIMNQYYHSSRERKGFEYHLAARAVKFIRDQAKAAKIMSDTEVKEQHQTSVNTAQLAASAIRKILKGDGGKPSIEVEQQEHLGLDVDPLDGWSDGVTLRKAHCCFLLKPQVVLRDEESDDLCVVAAVQAKLQSFAILDDANIHDPISGKIMSRNYTSLSGFQIFSPLHSAKPDRLRVPLEVLIDLRCESDEFERLVPQTDATFHYDKFNRLRLRNEVTSEVSTRSKSCSMTHTHLHDQTDLIRVHIPNFTVSANDRHFMTISNVVTKLLLFSDAAHKARLDRLERLLFNYDFTDLCQAADVVVNLQGRLRAALETENIIENNPRHLPGEEDTRLGRLRLRAHIIALTEELNCLFGAIKLAQDRTDEGMDRKSALLVHASSSELSWRMLGEDKDLLAKLVIQHSNFYWLSRRDSTMVNDLTIGNLQAFDGSRDAIWTEIVLKHDEPANHPLHKRNLFLSAHWSILPPVGGISIYETFELALHPLKVQVDAHVGRRIMEYLWPDRRHRPQSIEDNRGTPSSTPHEIPSSLDTHLHSPAIRSSLDSPRALQQLHPDSIISNRDLTSPGLRKLATSRSFTDLRSTRNGHHRSHLFPSNSGPSGRLELPETLTAASPGMKVDVAFVDDERSDAAVMMTRSSQKTFVFVKVASMNLVLSIVKEGSFECHDVRIKTKDLIYRNQTSSFEELVNQFIPSNMNWRGWMKMVFHQPLIPVLPVAKELLSKTKLIGSTNRHHEEPNKPRPGKETDTKKRALPFHVPGMSRSRSLHSKQPRKFEHRLDIPLSTSHPLTSEAVSQHVDEVGVLQPRHRSSFNILRQHHPSGRS